MASNSVLQPVTTRGWRAGFDNLFRKENRDWWGTRSVAGAGHHLDGHPDRHSGHGPVCAHGG